MIVACEDRVDSCARGVRELCNSRAAWNTECESGDNDGSDRRANWKHCQAMRERENATGLGPAANPGSVRASLARRSWLQALGCLLTLAGAEAGASQPGTADHAHRSSADRCVARRSFCVTESPGVKHEPFWRADGYPPHAWHGAGACLTWMKDYDTDAKKNGITGGVVTLGKPSPADVTGDRAHVVIPSNYL